MGERLVMQGTPNVGHTPIDGGERQRRVNAAVQAVIDAGLGEQDDVRAEVDEMWETVKNFHQMEPDEVMMHCSAFSSRLNEMRRLIYRIEPISSTWKPLRVNEVENALFEIKFQYEMASRLLSARQLDWEMERNPVRGRAPE